MKSSITIKLDSNLPREAKILAAEKGTSMSGLLASYLEEIVSKHKAYDRARKRALARLREGMDLHWIPGPRDELHQR